MNKQKRNRSSKLSVQILEHRFKRQLSGKEKPRCDGALFSCDGCQHGDHKFSRYDTLQLFLLSPDHISRNFKISLTDQLELSHLFLCSGKFVVCRKFCFHQLLNTVGKFHCVVLSNISTLYQTHLVLISYIRMYF